MSTDALKADHRFRVLMIAMFTAIVFSAESLHNTDYEYIVGEKETPSLSLFVVTYLADVGWLLVIAILAAVILYLTTAPRLRFVERGQLLPEGTADSLRLRIKQAMESLGVAKQSVVIRLTHSLRGHIRIYPAIHRIILQADSGFMAFAATNEPAGNAVLTHELSHVANADLKRTYLASALAWVMLVALLASAVLTLRIWIVWLFFRQAPGQMWSAFQQVPLLGLAENLIRFLLIGLLVRFSYRLFLRHREFAADALASRMGYKEQLIRLLRAEGPRQGLLKRAFSAHPLNQERAEALENDTAESRVGTGEIAIVGALTAAIVLFSFNLFDSGGRFVRELNAVLTPLAGAAGSSGTSEVVSRLNEAFVLLEDDLGPALYLLFVLISAAKTFVMAGGALAIAAWMVDACNRLQENRRIESRFRGVLRLVPGLFLGAIAAAYLFSVPKFSWMVGSRVAFGVVALAADLVIVVGVVSFLAALSAHSRARRAATMLLAAVMILWWMFKLSSLPELVFENRSGLVEEVLRYAADSFGALAFALAGIPFVLLGLATSHLVRRLNERRVGL